LKKKQAKAVVQERKIMAQLNHPFIIRLVETYQDENFVYMLLALVQGGELYSLLHSTNHDGISEKDAKFYSACILEALSYMHRRQIAYRDLKPENVLIAYGGYPVIVDLGFGESRQFSFRAYRWSYSFYYLLSLSETRTHENLYSLRNATVLSSRGYP
jgi:protein kinase A